MNNLKQGADLENCVNRIPEQATSTSAAEKYQEHNPICLIRSEQQTSWCRSHFKLAMFESQVNVNMTI
jgi:hypothetical protein